VQTNVAFARALLARPEVRAAEQDTGLIERILPELAIGAPDDLLPAGALAAAGTAHPDGPWRRVVSDVGELRVADGIVSIGSREWADTAVRFDREGAARVTLDGVERRYAVHTTADEIWVAREGHQLGLLTRRRGRNEAGELIDSLQAPLPGTVVAVNVSDGDPVQEGQVLVVLESMKMELSITAPHAGVVDGLELKPGDRVTVSQPLLAVRAREHS